MTILTANQYRALIAKKKRPKRHKSPIEIAKENAIRNRFVGEIAKLGAICTPEYQFHPKRKWRLDYAIVEHKIAIEVEGGVFTEGRHIRPQGFLGDMEKYNTATLLGWRLFRTTPDELFSKKFLEIIRQAIYVKIDKD